MIHPIDFLVRFVNPPAQPRDDIDYVIGRIKEVPKLPEKEPKEGGCDIRNPGASCLADMQEDFEVTAANPELRFPYWDVAESAKYNESVGHPRGLFPLPDFTDQLANIGGQQNDQADSITGETTNTENVGGMSGGGIFTGGTGTTESWYNGVKVSRYESPGLGANEDLEFFRREATEITTKTETFSPLEFDVAAPLVTDQHAMGCQLEAVGSNVCEQLKGVVPEWDLPFGCN